MTGIIYCVSICVSIVFGRTFGDFSFSFLISKKKFILGIEDLFEPIKVGRFCLLFKQPIFIFIRLKDLHHRKTVKP